MLDFATWNCTEAIHRNVHVGLIHTCVGVFPILAVETFTEEASPLMNASNTHCQTDLVAPALV